MTHGPVDKLPRKRSTSVRTRRAPTPEAVERALAYLGSLLLGARGSRIYHPDSRSFESLVLKLFSGARQLFELMGPFGIQFQGDVQLNGTSIRTADNSGWMDELRLLLAHHGIGGIEYKNPPQQKGARLLLLILTGEYDQDTAFGDLKIARVDILPVDRSGSETSRRMVEAYGSLLLALRREIAQVQFSRTGDPQDAPTVPPIPVPRMVQTLIDGSLVRPDLLAHLAANRSGAEPVELHGANTCLLSLLIGIALGVPLKNRVDLGVAALFRRVGASGDPEIAADTHASVAHLLCSGGIGHSVRRRSFIIGEHMRLLGDASVRQIDRPHLFSQILRVASAYDELVGGLGGTALSSVEALEALTQSPERFDPRLVDVLTNLLRAYPLGTEVVLDSGHQGVVARYGSSWDRPVVRIGAQEIDLTEQVNHRFRYRIAGTARFGPSLPALEIPAEPVEPEAIQPVELQPEALEPEAIQPVELQPEALEPEAIQPVELQPEALEPEAIQPTPGEPPEVVPEALPAKDPEPIQPEAIQRAAEEQVTPSSEDLEPLALDRAGFEDPDALESADPTALEPMDLEGLQAPPPDKTPPEPERPQPEEPKPASPRNRRRSDPIVPVAPSHVRTGGSASTVPRLRRPRPTQSRLVVVDSVVLAWIPGVGFFEMDVKRRK